MSPPSASSSSAAATAAERPLLPHRDRSPSRIGHEQNFTDMDDDDAESLDLEAYSPGSLSSPPPPYNLQNEKNSSRRSRKHPVVILNNLTRRPRLMALVGVILFLIAFATFAIVHVSSPLETKADAVAESTDSTKAVSDSVMPDTETESRYPKQVLGAPTDSFRDNLRSDVKYVTSWINAGWTNDVMSYFNLLYVAKISGRTAVLPPFAPSHLGSEAGYINFGEVFDIPRLSALMNVPIIEWRDIKNENSTVRDEIGCWSIWSTSSSEHRPRGNPIEPRLNLDVSYTGIPESAVLYPQIPNDPHVKFWSLATITFPTGRANAHLPSEAEFPSRYSGHRQLPDEQMACFDFPYYVCEVESFEFNFEWSPAWRFAGSLSHWTPRMTSIAEEALRATFGLGEGEKIPPFISIHARHGDFKQYCSSTFGNEEEGCFAPLSAFAKRVDEVKDELWEKNGIEVERVIVTSDERDAEWWAGVKDLGWNVVNHTTLGTEEKYGMWYPVFLDAIVQSMSAGFIGTDKSTMSLIAQRRVEDWNNGATREVRWGRTGADQHNKRDLEELHSELYF